MKINGKKLLSVLIAGAMIVFASPVANAANTSDYSVQVKEDRIYFSKGGKVVSAYTATATNLVLTSDKSHELYVQFPNSKGTTTSVTLGRQKNLTISGTMDSIAVRSALPDDISLTFAKGAATPKFLHYGKNNLTVSGTVDLMSIYNGSVTSITSSGSVSRVQLRASNARLSASGRVSVLEQVANAKAIGAGVAKLESLIREANSNEWGSSKNTASSVLTLHVDTLYATAGSVLWDLEHDLDNAVRAYNSKGRMVYGDVEFNISGATVLNKTRSIKCTFYPDDHSFKNTSASVKIVVTSRPTPTPVPNPTPSDWVVYTSASTITTNFFPDMRLGALETDLAYAASAWDQYGNAVAGYATFTNEGQRVNGSGDYSYIFYPSDGRYAIAMGTVYINVIDIEWGDTELSIGEGVTFD